MKTVGGFKFGDRASIDRALAESNADLVFFLTDFVAAGNKAAVEILFGTTIIDACKANRKVICFGLYFYSHFVVVVVVVVVVMLLLTDIDFSISFSTTPQATITTILHHLLSHHADISAPLHSWSMRNL